MFGITNTLLTDKFVNFLTDQGCLPAFFYYKDTQSRSGNRHWAINVNRVKTRIEKKSKIIINTDPQYALIQKSKLIKINRNVLDLPMRSLIYPFNGNTLNEKLYNFSTRDKLRDYRKHIDRGKLRKREIKFTSADLNNIKRAIIWLNWFMFDDSLQKTSTRPKNVDLCLSQDAVTVFALEGFDGLYRIAKKKKRDLKKCFSKFPEKKQSCMSFLSLASNDLNSLINYRVTSLRRENLFRCYTYFNDSHSNITEKRRMPNYYMYNPNILKTQKNLELLFDLGYKRMQHMKFLDRENEQIVQDPSIYELLHLNFSGFKRK